MKKQLLITLAVCLAVLGGCSPSPMPSIGGSSGMCTWAGDDRSQPGTVIYEDERFAIWVNAPNEKGGSSTRSGQDGLTREGQIFTASGQAVSFKCTAAEGNLGSMTLGGKTYDLANGGLILVTDGDPAPRIKQLNRTLEAIRFKPEVLREIASTDSEIRSFFNEPGDS